MANLAGYTSAYASTALAVSAFGKVGKTDFGLLGGAAPSLAYNAGAGSLAMTTARCAITWVTKQGESLPSAEATVAISASTGAFTITQPAVPTNGGTVLGWRVYSSSGSAGSALLNVAGASTTQVQSNIATTQGTLLAFPVATTAVQVLVYGAGQAEPTVDHSGIQLALPSISANSTANYNLVLPNNSGWYRQQKNVSLIQPDGTAEASGITLSLNANINLPAYPGASASASLGAYALINSVLYVATVGGTTGSTAPTFVVTKGSTTTDGSVTWTSLGRAILVQLHYANVSGSAAIPTAQTTLIIQQ